MGVKNMNIVKDTSKFWFADYNRQYMLPAIYITIFVSRALIFWLLNILCLYLIIHIFRVVAHQAVVRRKIVCQPMLPPRPPASKAPELKCTNNVCPRKAQSLGYTGYYGMTPSICGTPSMPSVNANITTCRPIVQSPMGVQSSPECSTRQKPRTFIDYLLDIC